MSHNRCWLFHRWDKWIVFEDRAYGFTNWIIRQKRVCSKCGITEVKEKVT